MPTFNTILEEMKDIPVDRLEEVYQLIHSLNPNKKQYAISGLRNKILSFAGAFSDMNSKVYADFLKQTKDTRAKLFDRKIVL